MWDSLSSYSANLPENFLGRYPQFMKQRQFCGFTGTKQQHNFWYLVNYQRSITSLPAEPCLLHLRQIEELVLNCNVMNLTVSGTLTSSLVATARWRCG